MKLLFVCTGNICRSPTAEAVMRRKVAEAGLGDRVWVDSAGTMAYHTGEPPDRRARVAGERRGYDLSGLSARLLKPRDFQTFDLILGMDAGHLRVMKRLHDGRGAAELALLMDYAAGQEGRDVPDPYYGQMADFETVLDLVELAVPGLMAEIRQRLS